MQQAMTPSFGARFEMTRRQVDAQAAIYDVTIFLPTTSQRYRLHIAQADGSCQLFAASGDGPAMQAADAALPDWVHKHLLALARQLFRGAQRDGQGELAWLRRLMRWHEEPQATQSRGSRLSSAV